MLTRKKIENFYPVNCRDMKSLKRNKISCEPLFDSYVFVSLPEREIQHLMQIDHVVSVVYWKRQPAVVSNDEIEVIKDFTNNHHNIKLLQTPVNIDNRAIIIDGPTYSIDGKVVSVKNKIIKVSLPSMGYTMVAEMEKESTVGREIFFGDKEMSLQ